MQANAGQVGQAQAQPALVRQVELPEFIKLAPPFDGKFTDPVRAKTWNTKVEKAFRAIH